jgi:hypothetical protein
VQVVWAKVVAVPTFSTFNTTIFHDAAHPSHITLPLWNSEGRAAL